MGLDLGKISASIGLNTLPLKAGVVQSKALLAGLGTSMKTSIGGGARSAEAGVAGLGARLGNLGGIGKNTGGIMAGLGAQIGTLGKIGIAVGAVLALGEGLMICVRAAEKQQNVMAQVNQAIKTTGGIANVTGKHVEDLAIKIARYSGVSHTAIETAASMEMAFTNVRNVGAEPMNQIFDRLLVTATDMSVRLGKEVPDSMKVLGKAMQDPLKGMTMLRRAGVVLTESEKELITRFMAVGDTMSAQKALLDALEVRYKGAAAAAGQTFAGAVAKLKEELVLVEEELGKDFLPQFTRGIQDLTNALRILNMVPMPKIFTVGTGILAGPKKMYQEVEQVINDFLDTIGVAPKTTIKFDVDTRASVSNIQDLVGGLGRWTDADYRAATSVSSLDSTVAELDQTIKDITANATGVGKKITDELALRGLAGVTKNDMIAVVHELQAAEDAIRDEGYKTMQGLLDSIARSSPEMQAHG